MAGNRKCAVATWCTSQSTCASVNTHVASASATPGVLHLSPKVTSDASEVNTRRAACDLSTRVHSNRYTWVRIRVLKGPSSGQLTVPAAYSSVLGVSSSCEEDTPRTPPPVYGGVREQRRGAPRRLPRRRHARGARAHPAVLRAARAAAAGGGHGGTAPLGPHPEASGAPRRHRPGGEQAARGALRA
eukprot:4203600-Pyramimonas_sp.AAC.2